ncbi:MAG: hydrogenase expression/formation protein [Betaproteobacteria bacterium]
MKTFPVPLRVTGPGSHVEEEELQYLDIPRDVSTFAMPIVPETEDTASLAIARDTLARLLAMMERWQPGTPHPVLDMRGVPAAAQVIASQVLGDGEVSIRVTGNRLLKVQESVFAGLWRVVELDGAGQLLADWLEAAPLPAAVLAAARDGTRDSLMPVEIADGAMNSPALLHELQAQLKSRKPGGKPHVLNLTLFPMTPEDHQMLERALPVGSVAIISRGFGNCRITSTTARNVWRVQYFNSMNTLILNTIEVVDVPEVALAAPEDLDDTRARLAELIDWMSESCAA